MTSLKTLCLTSTASHKENDDNDDDGDDDDDDYDDVDGCFYLLFALNSFNFDLLDVKSNSLIASLMEGKGKQARFVKTYFVNSLL